MSHPLRTYRVQVNGHEAELQLTEDDAQATGAILVQDTGPAQRAAAADEDAAEHKARTAGRGRARAPRVKDSDGGH
ncbi:hypothetical protein [Streptomyces abikoensis]|uniref:Uncharacterized protein n=1 Tax=Streptomyces abikoensis TaxID=97398 RepID=A0ABW7TDT7_9ACTN